MNAKVNIYEELIREYRDNLNEILNNIDISTISEMVEIVKNTYEKGKCIFCIGNGGSAATANHFAADFSKNAVSNGMKPPKVISLSTNVEYITALANDTGYDNVFAGQLENLASEGDLLIAISASGNSPNIIRAVETARKKGVYVIGMSGFTGGRLKEISDLSIYINAAKYELIEDVHLIILHSLVNCFKNIYKSNI